MIELVLTLMLYYHLFALYCRYAYCEKCFNEIPGDEVELVDDPNQPVTWVYYALFVSTVIDYWQLWIINFNCWWTCWTWIVVTVYCWLRCAYSVFHFGKLLFIIPGASTKVCSQKRRTANLSLNSKFIITVNWFMISFYFTQFYCEF